MQKENNYDYDEGICILKYHNGASEMAQQVKVPVTKPGDLSSTWDPHGVNKQTITTTITKPNQLTSCELTLCIQTHTYIHTLTHISIYTHKHIHTHAQTHTEIDR